MNKHSKSYMEKTVLTTPKPRATSTVERKGVQKNMLIPERLSTSSYEPDNSLGILSLNSFDLSHRSLQGKRNDDVSYRLEQVRALANNSLQRASKISGLPSRYLKPNPAPSVFESGCNLSSDSTINESDLLKTPRDKSTPRSSLTTSKPLFENSKTTRPSLGKTVAKLSQKIHSNMTFDNLTEELAKAMYFTKTSDVHENPVDSCDFMPAAEAESKLMADELSWRRRHNDLSAAESFSSKLLEPPSYKMSMGEFFQQKSDTISDLGAKSPKKHKPVPLIDNSMSFPDDTSQVVIPEQKNKSLSISTIAKFLSQTDDSPRKVVDYLLNQAKKSNTSASEQVSLPVSKDSSYTSNHSDNEIMQYLVNKENVNISNVQTKKSPNQSVRRKSPNLQENRSSSAASSARSSSCLTNLADGKLPIDSTKSELIWGCVKLDRCVTQEFVLRNRSSKTLRIQLSISGHPFRIRKDNRPDSDLLSSAKILLHAHESRPIIVSFTPTFLGAAIDEIAFTPLDSHLQQTKKQCIRLYGYGGYGNVEISNITKDTSNKFWLSLGQLNNSNVLKQSFIVKNTGTLPSFACFSFMSKELYKFSNVSISSDFFVLIPQEQKEITVSYVPSVGDYRHMLSFNNSCVIDIGVLKLISGTEANRGRLRRLCRKAKESGIQVDSLSNMLKENIEGEIIPSDIIRIKESVDSLKEVLNFFNPSNIVLTLEQDLEQTLMPQYPDDSSMFRTLCADSTTVLENTIQTDSCKIEPGNIILVPPKKLEDTLFLRSECKRTLNYSAKSVPEGLQIYPRVGEIRPNETIVLRVSCPQNVIDGTVFRVLVYIESEVFEATVKVVYIHSRS